jgi:regulator of protease activity HflC (stomatin/prohibitin superfamily)
MWMFSILLCLLAFGSGGLFLAFKDDDGSIFFGLGAVVLIVLSFGFGMWSVIGVVPTRNIGIVKSFGKPVGTRSNGLTWKAPWEQLADLDGTIQTDSQIGGFDANNHCTGGTAVRLANNSTACVDNTIRWRIKEQAADALFRDYKDNSNIRESLVTRDLNAALNAEFAAYNPLNPETAGGPNLADLSTKVTKDLQQKIGGQIEVQDVIISIVHLDGNTQDKVNAIQAKKADTSIAEESQKTAAAQAEANRILASSVNNDMNVLISRCLDLVNSGKGVMPCIPGAGLPFGR